MPISPEKYKGQSGPSFYTMASLPDFMLPGYGQILAGEKRKGVLFLVAHTLNLAMLCLIIFSQALSQSLSRFSQSYNLQLNQGLTGSLGELTVGSPDAFIALAIFVAFALFAARDAYEFKQKLIRQALYRDHVLPMPEAVSSSYIFHIVFLLVCMALAFFFLIPLAPPKQITDIEFIQAEENTREKPVTKIRSTINAKAAGQTRKTPPKAAAHESAQPKLQSAPSPKLAPPPVPALIASAAPPKLPTPTQKNLPSPLLPPSLNQLSMAPSNVPSPLHLPLNTPPSSTVGSANNTPRPHSPVVEAVGQAGLPVLSPVSVLAGAGPSKDVDNKPIQPAKIGKGNTDNAPIPKRGTESSAIAAGTVPGPVLGHYSGAARPGASQDNSQNTGAKPGDSPEVVGSPDWGPYMAELQRKIKQAWFPSKVGESKRVRVIFTVQKSGEMTNLRLLGSSGLQVVDAAALKAVEAAAPFRQLPAHSPASVDIEFTFDYNVFNGTFNAAGRGSLR